MKFKFLMENKTDNPGCIAEHGLSIYIEAHGRKLLFDAGASDLFLKNAKEMKVDLETVEALVISHGHYDHTEGVPAFCHLNKIAPVYIHKDAFAEAYGVINGEMEKEPCSILWNDQQRSIIDPRICCTDGPHWLSEDIVISGTVPDVPGEEPTELFYIKGRDGNYTPDSMNHEQILIIKEKEGIYIFSGCSHKGVIPVLRCAAELFPGEKIAALIAGMHLYSASPQVRKRIVERILAEKIERVFPVHCTGINAICDLKAALGDNCIVATAGDSYEY